MTIVEIQMPGPNAHPEAVAVMQAKGGAPVYLRVTDVLQSKMLGRERAYFRAEFKRGAWSIGEEAQEKEWT